MVAAVVVPQLRPSNNCQPQQATAEAVVLLDRVRCRGVKDRYSTQAKHAASRQETSRYCQACDKSFEPKRIDARFCSLACKQRAYRRRLSSVSASAGAFIVVALMLWPTVALAQQTRETFKDASGRTLGSATTDAKREHGLSPTRWPATPV